MRLFHLAFGAVAFVAVAGCGENPSAPLVQPHLAVTTDKSSYSLSNDSIVVVTLQNISDGIAYLPMDSYVVYERLVDGEWRDATDWFVVDGNAMSFPVEPGASLSDGLPIRFYIRDRPGTYRFRYFVYSDQEELRFAPPSFQSNFGAVHDRSVGGLT